MNVKSSVARPQRNRESKLRHDKRNNGQRFEKRTEGIDNADAIRNVARKVRRRNLYSNKTPRDCHVRAQFATSLFVLLFRALRDEKQKRRAVRDRTLTFEPHKRLRRRVIALSVNNFRTGRTIKPRE